MKIHTLSVNNYFPLNLFLSTVNAALPGKHYNVPLQEEVQVVSYLCLSLSYICACTNKKIAKIGVLRGLGQGRGVKKEGNYNGIHDEEGEY